MLDYAAFRHILEELYAHYPKGIGPNQIVSLTALPESEQEKTLCYLAEHGLVTVPIHKTLGGGRSYGRVTITKGGIDFLQPDGGLSALTAPVIRIAPESLVAIIDQVLVSRGASIEQRGFIKKSLGAAGSEGLKVIVQRLVDAGIAHTPDLMRLFTVP